MIRFVGKIVYSDGREQSVDGGAPAAAAWEEYAHRHGYSLKLDEAPSTLSNLVVLHALAGVDEGFETWRATVDNFELDSVAVDPFPPEVTADSLSSSHS